MSHKINEVSCDLHSKNKYEILDIQIILQLKDNSYKQASGRPNCKLTWLE